MHNGLPIITLGYTELVLYQLKIGAGEGFKGLNILTNRVSGMLQRASKPGLPVSGNGALVFGRSLNFG